MISKANNVRNIKVVKALRGDPLSIDLGASYTGTMVAQMKKNPNDNTYRQFTVVDGRYLTMTGSETSDFYNGTTLTEAVEGKWYFDVEWTPDSEGAVAQTIYTGSIIFYNDVTNSGGVQAAPIGEDLKTLHSISVNQIGHGFSVGDAINFNTNSYGLAQAITQATAGVLGLVMSVQDVDNFTYQFAGLYTEASYTEGQEYFLDPSEAGRIGNNLIYSDGEYVQYVGEATSEGLLLNIDYGHVYGSTSGGDMEKATYDPTNVEGDAFDMDNMSEGLTNLIFTDSERINLSNQSGTNTGDQDLSLLALKSNVLELDNTSAFTPNSDYEPSTKKYVDDSVANAGGGDMMKTTYDPNNVSGDAFDMDNMIEGTTNKILTATDLANISANNAKISYTDASAVAANTAKVGITPTQASDITTNNSKVSYTDSAAVAANTAKISFDSVSSTRLANTSGTNTGDQDLSGYAALADIPLEIIDEGNGNGIVRRSRNASFYGNVGLNAVDLSYADYGSTFGATGQVSFASGYANVVSGYGSAGLGTFNTITSDYAFGAGSSITLSGSGAFGIGSGVNVSGGTGGGFGVGITVSADRAMAFNGDILAGSYSSNYFGRFNELNNTNPTTWVGSDPLFVLANGTDVGNRNDAFTVLKDGTVFSDMTTAQITTRGNTALITKEYGDANYLGGGGTTET